MNHYPIGKKILRERLLMLLIQFIRPWVPDFWERYMRFVSVHELYKKGLSTERQVDVSIVYDGLTFNEGLRIDVLVERLVICELKAVDIINPVWEAQLLRHLQLTGKRLGFLINFNVAFSKDGIIRKIL